MIKRVDLSSFKNQKVALVLSGGVVKAASWHLGVALALDEMGFTLKHNESEENTSYEISTYVGSSAGSLINLYFANGIRPIDIIEATINREKSKIRPITYRDMIHLKRPMKKPPRTNFYAPFDGLPFFIRELLRPITGLSGIFTTHGLRNYVIKNIIHSNNFEDYKADMFVVATQLDHSRKCIFGKYNYPNPRHDNTSVYYTQIPVAESVAASMSVPPFYAPYPIKNPYSEQTDYYIDGEIRETLSTHVAIDNSCKFIISSWTHTPYHYHDEIGSLINYGLPAICIQAIHLMIQKKIVAARARLLASQDIIDTVNEYISSQNIADVHRKKILSILERKLHYHPDVHLIDIFPKHNNYQVFFSNSFSLDPKTTSEVVKLGYKRTFEVFKAFEWEGI